MRVVHGCKQSGAVLGLLTCLATSTALAQMRQASSHEHGRSSMNIVLEDRIVAVEVMGPMANFVGFEHAPSSDQEREAVAGARATLEMPQSLLELDPRANCIARSIQTDLPDMDEHEAHDEHEDDHDEHADHLEIAASYTLECANPDRITAIRVTLFEHFRSTEILEVNVLSDIGVTAVELTPESAELNLR